MKLAFDTLNLVSTEAPWALLLILANGILAPTLYALLKKLPFEISALRRRSKVGDHWATYAWYSWLVFAATATAVLLLVFGAGVSSRLN